jgi:hypothetical protein
MGRRGPRALSLALLAWASSCSAAPTSERAHPAVTASPAPLEPVSRVSPEAGRPASPCSSDDECRLDVGAGACAVDAALAATTPLVDQGTTCLCEGGACRSLTAQPVACEGDHSCAVRLTPRPHPVRRGLSSSDVPEVPCSAGATQALRVTCERTNLCTLHRAPCKGGPR